MGLVTGDPYGWQDIGYALSTLLGRLENEIATADAQGGTGLAGAWTGPAASEYLADWGRRHSRYADLIWHAQQAAAAIYNYGLRLADIVVQAGRLEQTWLAVGLDLGEAGFLLPLNFGALPQLSQHGLRQALTESERDVARIRADIVGAYEDLWIAVRDALIVLEDSELIGVQVIGPAALEGLRFSLDYLKKDWTSWHDLAGHALDFAEQREKQIEGRYNTLIKDIEKFNKDAPDEWKGLFDPEKGTLEDLAKSAKGAGKFVGRAGAVVAVGWTAWEIVDEAHFQHKGYRTAVEDHAGEIASIVVGGVAMTAGAAIATAVIVGAPAVIVAAGAVVIGGAIAFGVGEGVQALVDHRKAIGHMIDTAASWEERHALGWL